MTVFDVFASSKSSSPKETGEDGKIDCRVGFECQAGANDRAGGGRNSESDDSSNERLTPPLAFGVESPIKKMLLKELIEAHEKERKENGNLVEKVDSSVAHSTKTTTPKKKKKKMNTHTHAENGLLDDEEDDATLRSMSSTEQCFESTALYHNFSEPIPIPVADVRLRCVFRLCAFQSAFPHILFPFPSSLSFFLTCLLLGRYFRGQKALFESGPMCDGNTLKKKLSVDLISPKRQKKRKKKSFLTLTFEKNEFYYCLLLLLVQ